MMAPTTSTLFCSNGKPHSQGTHAGLCTPCHDSSWDSFFIRTFHRQFLRTLCSKWPVWLSPRLIFIVAVTGVVRDYAY